ncbi:MAG: hypothetical protein KDD69_09025 [Bdellovibrionales bacterium]|nr:hypothetical protein [Bdellovibrionales bacterium]
MGRTTCIVGATTLFAALGLTACDVDQTREAKIPDVDVEAEGGQLPEYEVRTPDVDVGTERARMKVPDVDLEETDVTVPSIDVDIPEENENTPTR